VQVQTRACASTVRLFSVKGRTRNLALHSWRRSVGARLLARRAGARAQSQGAEVGCAPEHVRNARQPTCYTRTCAQSAVAAAAAHLPADFRGPMLAHFLHKQVRAIITKRVTRPRAEPLVHLVCALSLRPGRG